jgi:hypothetical protein
MKNLSIIYLIFVSVLILTSCSDVLDTKNSTEYSSVDVWSDVSLAQTYVNQLYRDVPWDYDMTSELCDECRMRSSENETDFNNMLMTADNATNWGGWNDRYSNIRKCNIFLENIDNLPESPEVTDGKTDKERMKGEVTFLRAWFYHMLVSYYGGVPLVTKSYTLTDDFSIARSSYKDCIDFIAAECDTAAALLPEVNTGDNIGRATKGAALALKSRVLLYAASDLHNTDKFSGYSNPEYLGYVDGNQSDRWLAAKNAAKAVMDLGLYGLYEPEPASARDASTNYYNLFIETSATCEDIFVRYWNADAEKGVYWFELYPCGWYGNGRNGFTKSTVDAYEMEDGTKFSWDNATQSAEPYKNRDPRFYGSVIYEGDTLRPRTDDAADQDPVGVMQAGHWEIWDEETSSVKEVWGLDTEYGPINSWNCNKTGTGCKKFLNVSTSISSSWDKHANLTWRYFRYAEILLNYAEACIELGEEGEAKTYLNMIRKRACMPEITDSGNELLARCRNERRIEMLGEDQRFFDVRRWLIATEAYHDMYGVKIVYELQPDHTTATIPTITPYQITTGCWDDKAYFLPISRDELNKNSELVQNPGYE